MSKEVRNDSKWVHTFLSVFDMLERPELSKLILKTPKKRGRPWSELVKPNKKRNHEEDEEKINLPKLIGISYFPLYPKFFCALLNY